MKLKKTHHYIYGNIFDIFIVLGFYLKLFWHNAFIQKRRQYNLNA
jgi:hypothetical protein